MKITDIKCVIFEWASPDGIGGMMHRVLTDEGIEGKRGL